MAFFSPGRSGKFGMWNTEWLYHAVFRQRFQGVPFPPRALFPILFCQKASKRLKGEEVFLKDSEKRIQREGGMKHGRQIKLFRV